MKPRSAKNKGVRLQNWVRDLLRSTFTSLEDADVLSAIMGEGGEDLKLSPAARLLLPFSFECKNTEKISIYNAYKQCIDNAPENCEPILIIKKNNHKALAVLDAEKLIKIFKEISYE